MKIVVYHTTNCGPCKRFMPLAEQTSKELEIGYEHVNVTENPTAGIRLSPTTRLVDDAGNEVAEHGGTMSKIALKKWIENNTPA